MLSPTTAVLALPLAGLLLLAACRKEVPLPQVPPVQPTPRVDSSGPERPAASDQPQAPPTVGAVVANQDHGGARGRPSVPTGGDGNSAASGASAASR